MTKPLCSELADIEWLTGAEAGAILTELAEDATPLHTAAARLRSRHSAKRTHLLLEQVELRRRAAAKFTHPERMFFTRVGLEQATDEWVAAYKATRFFQRRAGSLGPISKLSRRGGQSQFAPRTPQIWDSPRQFWDRSLSARSSPPAAQINCETSSRVAYVADLCCGIGGDLMQLARLGMVVGVDRDPISAHFAAVNSGTDVRATDIADFDWGGVDAWHIDPDRRPSGRRTTSLDRCEPNREAIERLLACSPDGAVKLAPATDVPTKWAERCELEWISRDRECKQLVAWHGNLAANPGQRRATIVVQRASWGVPAPDVECRTIIGTADQPLPIASNISEYVFDVDSSVTAARLTGVIAVEHGLSSLGSGPTYLTGTLPIDDAAIACFRVNDVLPMRIGKLAQYLRAHNIGQLEIKKRGVEIAPDKFRRDLKLRGSNAATLLIVKVGGRPVAILAERVTS